MTGLTDVAQELVTQAKLLALGDPIPSPAVVHHPCDLREARLLNYFQQQQEWFQYRFWPRWAQVKMLQQHKKRFDRFNLMYWMLWNGLHPETAKYWIMARDVDAKGKALDLGTYDKNADEDLEGMIAKHAKGELYDKQKRVYDMVYCCVVDTVK